MLRGMTMVLAVAMASCTVTGEAERPDAPHTPPAPVDAPSEVRVDALAIERLLDAMALVTGLGRGFGPSLDVLDPAVSPSDETVRHVVEASLARWQFVISHECTSTVWTSSRAARVTLTDCTLVVTGEAMFGVMTVELDGRGTLHVSLDELTVGAVTLSGAVRVRRTAPLAAGPTIEGVVTYDDGAMPASLAVDRCLVFFDGARVRAMMVGQYRMTDRSGPVDLRLGWRRGECLPTASTLVFEGAPFGWRTTLELSDDAASSGAVAGSTLILQRCE